MTSTVAEGEASKAKLDRYSQKRWRQLVGEFVNDGACGQYSARTKEEANRTNLDGPGRTWSWAMGDTLGVSRGASTVRTEVLLSCFHYFAVAT